MRYARIDNNQVVEFLETDGDITTMFHPSILWVPCEDLEVTTDDQYINGQFLPPPPPPDLRPQVWDEFRMRRDLYLARLGEIAGRYSRQGDTAVPPAADNIAVGLLNMPQDPTLLALPSAQALSTGIVVAANNLLKTQLFAPDGTLKPTGPAVKAALDKVFK